MLTQEMEVVRTDAMEVDGTWQENSDSDGDTTEQSLDTVESWIRDKLPDLNTTVEDDGINAVEFVEVIRPKVEALQSLFGMSTAGISKRVAKRVLKLLGFLIGSAERHFQMSGKPKGTTWKFLPDAEYFLADIAEVIGLPPILSLDGYWLEDRGRNALTFTGEVGERAFKGCVQVWNACCETASNLLRPICLGDVPVESDAAVMAINKAMKCYSAIGEKYEEMRKSPSAGRAGLTPEVFNRFRVYLCGYPVRGKESTGPNAANLRSNFSADLLSGVSDETYFDKITERMDYLTPEDREVVQTDMALPSVVDQFLGRLGFSKAELVASETAVVAQRIADQSATFRDGLTEYKDLYRAICTLSAKHWGSIRNILIKPFEKMTPEEKDRLPVSPDKSVGGAGHERPEAIFNMRKENPVVKKLLAGLDMFQKLNGSKLTAM